MNLSVTQQLRLRYGLRWSRHYPDLSVAYRFLFKCSVLAVIVWLAYGLMNAEATAQQLAELAESNAAWAQVAIDCLNNSNGFYVKDAEIAVMCQRI